MTVRNAPRCPWRPVFVDNGVNGFLATVVNILSGHDWSLAAASAASEQLSRGPPVLLEVASSSHI
jgi:hypothetical protein